MSNPAGGAETRAHRASGNRFIDALPRELGSALTGAADLRVFDEGRTILERGMRLRDVYFPVSGAIAHLERHDDGRGAEIYAVGRDGLSGFEALLGHPVALHTLSPNVPVAAFAIGVNTLGRMHDGAPALRTLLQRYAVAMMRIAGISAACERHHRVTARLAKRLLELHDHTGNDELAVTHERVATMLGTRRAGVTRAYSEIARTGAICVERGRIAVVDTAALETLTCICHGETKRIVDAVYAPPPAALHADAV